VIDILAVGVAMRRGAEDVLPEQAAGALDEAHPEPRTPGVLRSAPGVSLAGPLARLTSHSR